MYTRVVQIGLLCGSRGHMTILGDVGAYCRVTLKLGARFEMGDLLPLESDGWKLATCGEGFAVWEAAV